MYYVLLFVFVDTIIRITEQQKCAHLLRDTLNKFQLQPQIQEVRTY